MADERVFLLSPARCAGKRADLVLNRNAEFDLALRLRSKSGVTLGELFTFLSGLYFRGKLSYARRFARPPIGTAGVWIITPDRGLQEPEENIDLLTLKRFARRAVDPRVPAYRRPLTEGARRLAAQLGPQCSVVLLGSIASAKYLEVLLDIFGDRLCFPREFIGRGDMSRGGLLLRCIDQQCELDYLPARGALRHGERPPRLERR